MMKSNQLSPVGYGALVVAVLLLIVTAAVPRADEAVRLDDRMRISVAFDVDDLQFRTQEGFVIAELPDAGYVTEPGHPMLPVRQVRIALPAGMQAGAVALRRADFVRLPGAYDLYPAQPPRRIGDADGPFVPPDPRLYASEEAWPTEVVTLRGHSDLAGQGLALIELRPLRYSPGARRLELAGEIEFDLILEPGYVCGDYLPAAASLDEAQRIAERIAAQVLNPGDVQPQTAGHGTELRSNLEPGTYDYVIIARSTLAPSFEPLAAWKTRKGVPSRIVTTDWIYDAGGYSGSEAEQIRAFIIDAHNEWGTTHILLGGDTNTIPCHWRNTPIEPYSIPNDTYYADFDDDWTVEVAVGRAPVRYTSYVETFSQKILTYEQTPPLNDYAQEILMLGFDLDGSTAGEICKQDITAQDVPADWAVQTVYDSDPGAHQDDVISLLDAGPGLVNHIDHCDSNEMGVGSVNHDESLYSNDFAGLTNQLEQPILYSLGCYANDYEDHTCIAEHAVRYDTGGCIAFAGNSRYGWYNPGTTQTLSFRYDRQFFRQLFDASEPVLGDVFAAHKNAFYPIDNTYRYIFTELTLLGDPQLEIWTGDPAPLQVAHDPNLLAGPNDLTVAVTTAEGAPLAGARVCIWKGEEVYERAWTDGVGMATLDFESQSAGEMLLTVTAHNSVPYLGSVQVLDHSGAVVSADPAPTYRLLPSRRNPFRDGTELRFALPRPTAVWLRIYDVGGREVRNLLAGQTLGAGEHAYPWNGRDDAGRVLASGVYLCRFDAGAFQAARRLVLSR
ncbi:MAG: hypothetical protein GF330_10870 [Candidatus Eisenbacteria bacterium]|nr:hypothetical protein [Candidatus Eisenbacteria bacterium]